VVTSAASLRGGWWRAVDVQRCERVAQVVQCTLSADVALSGRGVSGTPLTWLKQVLELPLTGRGDG
jgi:hypothetical protein